MARKVMFVESYEGYQDGRRHLVVDEYVDLDMKIAVDPIRTEDKGSLTFTSPTYGIWARPRTAFLDPHGHVKDQDDIRWLERTPRKYDEQFICRVNQLNVEDKHSGKRGFLIEVTSGLDSRQITRAENHELYTTFFKEHWWQLGLALVVAWWWFF